MDLPKPTGAIAELGLQLSRIDGGLAANLWVNHHMWAPGTTCVRTSILALTTDVVAGMLVGLHVGPRVPVTIELCVDLLGLPADITELSATGRLTKTGRTVVFATVDFSKASGDPVALGSASFAVAPDDALLLPDLRPLLNPWRRVPTQLEAPFAERAACERLAIGKARMLPTDGGRNASDPINGGLTALVVEEAVLSMAPRHTLTSLGLRYLRPARVGPIVAEATDRGPVVTVEAQDAGNDDRVVVLGTARTSAGDPNLRYSARLSGLDGRRVNRTGPG